MTAREIAEAATGRCLNDSIDAAACCDCIAAEIEPLVALAQDLRAWVKEHVELNDVRGVTLLYRADEILKL